MVCVYELCTCGPKLGSSNGVPCVCAELTCGGVFYLFYFLGRQSKKNNFIALVGRLNAPVVMAA